MNTVSSANPRVSFVISTQNRRDVLLRTLERIHECGLDRADFEILVVDNASCDGTADAIASKFLNVRVFALLRNLGPCAKNVGVDRAKGEYIVFLDDDSYPHPGSVGRMIEHFEANSSLGAAVFNVSLPQGSRESCAYPSVFIGCGTGFRADALRKVGGLPLDFFMAAEEYDLSLRLLDGGWDIKTFPDLHVTHLKVPIARDPWRVMRLDVRNNFVVATRYLPQPWLREFAMDWMLRYHRIASTRGQRSAFYVGLVQGALRTIRPRHRRPVSQNTFERFTLMQEIQRRLTMVQKKLGLRSVLFVDYGKNILPYWVAARQCGLKVVAIADEHLARTGKYRGISIVDDALARCMEFDAAIISNSSQVQSQSRTQAWRELDRRPVINLFESDGPDPTIVPAHSSQGHAGMAA